MGIWVFFKSYILRQSTEGEGCAGAAEPPPTCADGAVLSVGLALLAPRLSRARHSPPGPGAPAAARARPPLGLSPGARPGLRGRRVRAQGARKPPLAGTRFFRVQKYKRALTTLAPKIR